MKSRHLVCLLPFLFHAIAAAQSATVPLIVEENVPMIDLQFQRADGQMVTGRFLLDSGGGAFLLTEKLAKAIGLEPSAPPQEAEGATFAPAPAPVVRVGGMPLDLKGAHVMIQYGSDRLERRDAADGLFPGHVLQRYHVVFDYPGRTFTLSAPGLLKPRGTAVSTPVNGQNGFARLEIAMAGRKFGFLLDTGASFTMISRKAIQDLTAEAPWPQITGAVGPANMGAQSDAQALMVRLPGLKWGDFAVAGAAAVSREEGTFEKSMSRLMVAPIIGALGGNVLRQFRVEIDYANGITYFERVGKTEPGDLDLIGLSLSETPGHAIVVTGVSPAADPKLREQVRPGDLLRRVDGTDVDGMSLMQIVGRMRGKPGDRKTLGLERDGKPLQVETVVTHIL